MTHPLLAAARTDGSDGSGPSRPPGAAWSPGTSIAAVAELLTRGTVALPDLADVCAPHVFGVSLPVTGLSSVAMVDGDARCALTDAPRWPMLTWRPVNLDDAAVLLQVELREMLAGPAGFLARLLPDGPAAADFLPDLRALTTSPVPGVKSSGFGWRSDPILHRAKFHKGTDFRARQGTPVYAAGAGRVVFTGQQHGYGNIIYVDHGGGVVTRYAHLSRFEIARGELVTDGRLIGRVGATGRATGPHLHFEVRLGDRAVEPAMAMAIAALERTDPEAARAEAPRLAAAIQDQTVDTIDPPGGSHRAGGRHRGGHGRGRGHGHGGRPERTGAPHRDRNQS